jgi:uncharacterized protein
MNNLLSGEPVVIDSGNPGSALLILGGVHGDELCGIEAVRKLAEAPPSLVRGRLILAIGNPEAVALDTRCVKHNLNRAFLSEDAAPCACAEHERARQLKALLESADVLLDIHASFTPETEPFIICEPNASPLARFLPFSRVCHGFDLHQPGGTDYYMNRSGKIGICIECGYLKEEAAAPLAMRSAEQTLLVLGMLRDQSPPVPQAQEFFSVMLQYFVKRNFRLEKALRDFAAFRAGDRIGWDGDEAVLAPADGCILFARDRSIPGDEAFVYLKSIS